MKRVYDRHIGSLHIYLLFPVAWAWGLRCERRFYALWLGPVAVTVTVPIKQSTEAW